MTIVTVAHYRLPDSPAREEVLAMLAPIVSSTRAEEGNRGIEIIQDSEDAHHLVLIERWASPHALERHRQTPHFLNGIVGAIAPRLLSREVMGGLKLEI